jgi:hypothetical protein
MAWNLLNCPITHTTLQLWKKVAKKLAWIQRERERAKRRKVGWWYGDSSDWVGRAFVSVESLFVIDDAFGVETE